jgi:uncharacterized integral membrane protein (TIGR00697 family)
MMDRKSSQVSVLFMLFAVLFCVCLIAANALETKQFMVGPVNFTGGLIVFPVSYILNDVVCEVWGYSRARMLIWLGFLMNFLFVAFGAVADLIPGAPYWGMQEGFHAIFGLAPRIAGASFLAFLVGAFINAYVMSRMKLKSEGRHFVARAVWSTVAGETCDSLLFFPLALGGVVPWEQIPSMIISQVVLKTLYEVLILPVTLRVVKATKRLEDEDVFDEGISYNVFKINRI